MCGKINFAQKTPIKKAKDTIKTEVVNVVTSYAPKVTDAFKIKRKPVIKLSNNVDKKALNYTIVSVPVASTFVPKSGVLKGIDVGKKERIYNNYVALGFGNNITPMVEAFFHKNTPFDSEYGINFNAIYSNDPVKNTQLSSSFYNIGLDVFYKQEQQYFNWTAGLKAHRNKYNWYGLPQNIPFKKQVINVIEEEQTYKDYTVFGKLDFEDSYIKEGEININYFSDILDNNEFNVDFNSGFSFPIGRAGTYLEDIQLGFSLNFLGGSFAYDYIDKKEKKHSLFTAGLNPFYQFSVYNFDIKFGGKVYFSMDTENSQNAFFFYPDVHVSYPIISKFANLYVGATGNLQNNSFKSLATENPYIAPTATIKQTSDVYNFFGGLKGILAENINYNIKASYKHQENKPLFALYASKSNGVTTAEVSGFSFFGYEYGNAFNVIYDDVKTINVFGEIEYDASKDLAIGLSGEFNSYTTNLQPEAWNLPLFKTEVFGKYKTEKWFAGANLFFVGNRKGITHNGTVANTINLNSYIDLNVNGGYHFTPLFSAFLRANNITNSNYQKFTNFNAQGFQILGGIIYKFDSLF